MDIVNDTDQDAKVKLSGSGSGGPAGGPPGSPKGRSFREIRGQEWLVRPGQTLTPQPPPTLPVTVFFYIKELDRRTRRSKEHEVRREVRAPLKGLKLTKASSNGYVVKPIRTRKS